MRKLLVTGADGFIGSHLTEALVRAGYDVRAFVLYNSFNSWGWLDHCAPDCRGRFEVFAGDVRDPHGVRSAMRDCDAVLHLAALIGIPYSYHSPDTYVDTNVKGTLNVVQAARDIGVQRVVHTSTSEVYGTARFVPITEDHPLQGQSPYSATKIGADHLAMSFHLSFGTPVTIVRPFNTYGPRQSARAVIPTIVTQIASGARRVNLGSLHPTRDFSFVADTVAGFIAALRSDRAIGEVVNLGSSLEVSIGDLARTIAELMCADVEIASRDERRRPETSEVERLWADTRKAADILEWRPAYGGPEGFRRGLTETIAWFRDPQHLAMYKADVYNVWLPLVIAEAGVNHNGDPELALRLVDAAADARADVVKFQTFDADRLATRTAPKADYQDRAAGVRESQHAMLKRLELTRDTHVRLIERCRTRGVGFLSTGFDIDSVAMLAGLGLDRFKIPSGDITNLPYLRHVGSYGRPVILSTGMATMDEISASLEALESAGTPRRRVTLLHCTSAYPARMADVNLRAIATLREAFGTDVGYSDHTEGIEVAIAAVALGASVIEKHVTLDRTMDGPDHRASLEPQDLAAMIAAIRNIEAALGDGRKRPMPGEEGTRAAARKSLVAAVPIRAGETFSERNVVAKRSSSGLSPMRWDDVVGRVAERDYAPDEGIEL